MFNIDTILSSFDCKLTLLEWLKKLTKALENDSLKDVQINKIASGKAQMVLTFADGTIQASNVFELPQGETGATGAKGDKGDTGDGFNTLDKMIVSYADNVISVADGFQIDIATQFKTIVGDLLATASGTFTLPIEGTGTIICDVDEANKKINIHLDAAYKNKIDRALQLPATAPTATQLVGVGTNNAQTMVGVGDYIRILNNTLGLNVKFGQFYLSINDIVSKTRLDCGFVGIMFADQTPMQAVKEYIANLGNVYVNGYYSNEDGSNAVAILYVSDIDERDGVTVQIIQNGTATSKYLQGDGQVEFYEF